MNKIKFNKIPMCEVCKKEPATSFSFFWKDHPKECIGDLELSPALTLTGDELLNAMNNVNNPEIEERHKQEWLDIKKAFVEARRDGICKFAGNCTQDKEVYYIYIDDFFNNPSSMIDWLAHMHEKNWFNEYDFFEMMDRFRKATDSFNAL